MKYVTVSRELEKAVREKMEATLDICRKRYNKDIPTPPLRFVQLGRRAGVHNYKFNRLSRLAHSHEIRINPDFFKKYYDEMLNTIVPHEIAHYIAVVLYGRNEGSGHGWRWREVMSVIGIPAANRCHQFDMEGVKVRAGKETPFKYSCRCDKPHMLTRTVHQRHQASVAIGKRGYKCTKCRQFLVYEGYMNGETFVPKPSAVPVVSVKEVKVEQIIPRNLFPKLEVVATPPPKPVATQPAFRTVTKFVDGVLTNVRIPLTQAA